MHWRYVLNKPVQSPRVFVNPDLTKAEAEQAYLKRKERRERQAVAATTNPATANVTITLGISYSAASVPDNLSSDHLNPLAQPFPTEVC